MSISIADPAGFAATGTVSALFLAGLAIWRLGIECERAWLASLAAPPEPWEEAFNSRMLAQARAAARPAGAKQETLERPPAESAETEAALV